MGIIELYDFLNLGLGVRDGEVRDLKYKRGLVREKFFIVGFGD